MVVKVPQNKVTGNAIMHKSDKKYNFVKKGGKSIIERRPAFSPDGEWVMAIIIYVTNIYPVQSFI